MKVIAAKTCLYALVAAGALTIGTLGMSASAQAENYNATVYVAGMGGHFAKADVEIDPAAVTPIILKGIDKVDIGDAASHPTHDARIDYQKRDLMFWSTYKPNPETGSPHVGATDLKTGN
ncbi:MAG: hypothetical protein PHX57_14040, partial [Desulfobulbaceae bacterium]|nr:hypothetical protein [Desulfobulbaceae bacterium]